MYSSTLWCVELWIHFCLFSFALGMFYIWEFEFLQFQKILSYYIFEYCFLPFSFLMVLLDFYWNFYLYSPCILSVFCWWNIYFYIFLFWENSSVLYSYLLKLNIFISYIEIFLLYWLKYFKISHVVSFFKYLPNIFILLILIL